MTTAVDRLLAAMEAGTGVGDDVYAADATWDATVPNWRFPLRGADAIRRQLASWFPAPGTFEEIERLPVEGGELVLFQIRWLLDGELHAARQSHVLKVAGDRIVSHTAFCGGRWPAARLAEMAPAYA